MLVHYDLEINIIPIASGHEAESNKTLTTLSVNLQATKDVLAFMRILEPSTPDAYKVWGSKMSEYFYRNCPGGFVEGLRNGLMNAYGIKRKQ